jgi:hypothetical protein
MGGIVARSRGQVTLYSGGLDANDSYPGLLQFVTINLLTIAREYGIIALLNQGTTMEIIIYLVIFFALTAPIWWGQWR